MSPPSLGAIRTHIQPPTMAGLREKLAGGAFTPQEVFQETSRLLSSVSQSVGLVVGPRFSPTLSQLKSSNFCRSFQACLNVSVSPSPMRRFIRVRIFR